MQNVILKQFIRNIGISVDASIQNILQSLGIHLKDAVEEFSNMGNDIQVWSPFGTD